MDSHQAFLPDAIGVIQIRSRRICAGIQNPWMDFSLPSMARDTRFPAGMTSLHIIWQSRINNSKKHVKSIIIQTITVNNSNRVKVMTYYQSNMKDPD